MLDFSHGDCSAFEFAFETNMLHTYTGSAEFPAVDSEDSGDGRWISFVSLPLSGFGTA